MLTKGDKETSVEDYVEKKACRTKTNREKWKIEQGDQEEIKHVS